MIPDNTQKYQDLMASGISKTLRFYELCKPRQSWNFNKERLEKKNIFSDKHNNFFVSKIGYFLGNYKKCFL